MTYKKVNGAYMRMCQGSSVSLMGLVNNADRSGRFINVLTTDNVNVKVRFINLIKNIYVVLRDIFFILIYSNYFGFQVILNEPLSEPLSGWIEIIGQPVGKDSINCNQYVIIGSDEQTEDFDKKAYNYLVQVLNNATDPFEIAP